MERAEQKSGMHTATPWLMKRGHETDDCRGVFIIENASHDVVAEFVWEDDARLIAAAPELLAALQEARDVLAMLTDPERIKESRVQIAWAQAVAAEAKARAALARATGDQS
jgi:hypothetical protein